ncbi:MAG TPA: sugar-binding domain-containing protein [Devosia sp.]|nr:sugar-binding domain-containing protein [Devosia sp.]
MSISTNATMLRCCYLFYQDQMTIQQIAERLDISRFKVSRHLKEAQRRGIVEVQFHDPNVEFERLGLELEQLLGLRQAIVVPTPYGASPESVRLAVGRAGADIFNDVTPETSVAITWGRTVAHMVDSLPADRLQAKRVVDLAGGFGEISSSVSARAVTLRSAEKLGAECVQVPAPTIVGSVETARSLLAEPSIRRVLDLAAASQIAVTGIGPLNEDSLLVKSGFLSDADLDLLRAKGAVGSVIGRFYDVDGNELDTEFRDRAIALDLERFKKIPSRIAFAGGESKLDSLVGLARGRLISTLVTDSQTAAALAARFKSSAMDEDASPARVGVREET